MIATRALVLFCFSTVLLSLKVSQAAILRNSIHEGAENISFEDETIKENIFGILNGTKSDIKHHPYQAAVFLFDRFKYSGAIINENHIVTVAILPYFTTHITVGVGKSLISEMEEKVAVEKITIHPKYNLGLDYDISVLKLKTPLKFSNTVKSIAIPTTGSRTGESATVSGWGVTNAKDLRNTDRIIALTQEVITQKDCKPYYVSSIVSSSSICAYKSEYASPASFDFGDPLVKNNKLQGFYIGQYSTYGVCQNLTKCPSIYTDVVSIRDWITKTAK